jgi:3-oxoacyl-[acyl-carrier protein] reductase
VSVLDRDAAQLKQAWDGRDGVRQVALDVSDSAAVDEAVEGIVAWAGGIDVAVNNAGISRDAVVWKLTDEQWKAVLDVHLGGTFAVTRAVIPHMRAAGSGRIVNVTSYTGMHGNVGQANYAAAKGGLIAWTKSLALELARHGVTANCVCPGFTDTDMLAGVPAPIREKLLARVPLGRFARPDEIARAIVFVAESDYMTGTCLDINGGLRM